MTARRKLKLELLVAYSISTLETSAMPKRTWLYYVLPYVAIIADAVVSVHLVELYLG